MTNNLRRRQARCLAHPSPGLIERGNGCGVAMGILVGMMAAGGVQADGEVSTILTSLKPATPFAYTAGGIEYQWGMGSNQIMEGFTADERSFAYAMSADRVEIQRHDIPGVATGEPCGIFVERLSDSDATRQYAADYPSDGSDTGNCDIAAMLSSRVLNRGALDLFSNQLPDAKNIERLDYIFDYGVLSPIAAGMMDLAGHVASEKRGNNAVKMAAILSLDILGQPASYGPLTLIDASGCSAPALCYGTTDLQHQYSFLQNEFNAPQSFPVETAQRFESVAMAFVSTAELGLQPGQRYYGFSVFADDVDAEQHDLLDPTTFPTDTADNYILPGDDADIYGGLSGYFVADDLSITFGAVFNDIDGNGTPDDNEAGISDIQITLYEDVNGNGIVDAGVDAQIGDTIDTDMSGNFVLPGLPDGNYIVEMDEQDPDLPAGLVNVPGTNPHPMMVAGGDSDPVYFPFFDPDGNGGNGTGGGIDSGNGDGGADGNTDSGNGDGGADGNTDSGNGDGGADGNTDSGNGDGGADGNADSGNGDGGADGNTDSGNGDGGADGNTDSGNDDGGLNDGSSTDAVDDMFEVNQGRAGLFDVLANDVDGVGDGLTLISVSQSPNAAVSLVDNQVDYRPNYGFYGTDTFLYTMQDGSGTQFSGNVEVNVIHFSDLNDNGLNDFVECDCTDLTLQTGVNGSGVGSLSLFGAWALLMGLGVRRMRARQASPAERGVF